MGMTAQAIEVPGQAPDHEQKRAALGYLNAAWIPDKHKLFLCYELAQDFADLYRDYGETRQSGRTRRSR